jgi:hypothetical protein|tara:strand:+ start:188 stop:406 length:219 start_codon:yes stop_codon:yes gene_type:complete
MTYESRQTLGMDRANARTEEDPHDCMTAQGYDEFPIDQAILQQAENYRLNPGDIKSKRFPRTLYPAGIMNRF